VCNAVAAVSEGVVHRLPVASRFADDGCHGHDPTGRYVSRCQGDDPREAGPTWGDVAVQPLDRETTMDVAQRRELARRALDGDLSGRAAAIRATAGALAKVDSAVAVVFVEGISDQIALETAAVCRGRDLAAERVVIVPIGGAHAIGRLLTRLGPLRPGRDLPVCVTCMSRRYSGGDWSRPMSAHPVPRPTWRASGSTSALMIWRMS
jgi:hypothetical protein